MSRLIWVYTVCKPWPIKRSLVAIDIYGEAARVQSGKETRAEVIKLFLFKTNSDSDSSKTQGPEVIKLCSNLRLKHVDTEHTLSINQSACLSQRLIKCYNLGPKGQGYEAFFCLKPTQIGKCWV